MGSKTTKLILLDSLLQEKNAWIYPQGCCHRRQRPHEWTSRLHGRQTDPQWAEGRYREMRGDQHFWKLLPQQAEVSRLPEEALQREAQPWSLPLQGSLQDLLENCQRDDSSQDREREGCSEASPDIRGSSSPL